MKRTSAYDDELMAALKNPEEAAEYLNAALADPDQEVFLLALRDVDCSPWRNIKVCGKSDTQSR